MLSHFMPNQIDMAIVLSNEAIINQQHLNKRTVELIAGAPGPFTLIAHESYFYERIQDVRTIIGRLRSNIALETELSIKEGKLRPKKRIYKKTLSKRLQQVFQKSQEVHQQIKLDMESLYIFGNLLLDQWAHIVGYVINDQEPAKFSFATFVDKVQKKVKREYWTLSGKNIVKTFCGCFICYGTIETCLLSI